MNDAMNIVLACRQLGKTDAQGRESLTVLDSVSLDVRGG